MRPIALAILFVLIAAPLAAQTDIPEHRRVCITANTMFSLGGSHDGQRVSWYQVTIVDAATDRTVFRTHVNIGARTPDGFGGYYVRFQNLPGLNPGRYLAYLGAYNDQKGAPGLPFELTVPSPTDPPCPIQFPWVVQGNRVQP